MVPVLPFPTLQHTVLATVSFPGPLTRKGIPNHWNTENSTSRTDRVAMREEQRLFPYDIYMLLCSFEGACRRFIGIITSQEKSGYPFLTVKRYLHDTSNVAATPIHQLDQFLPLLVGVLSALIVAAREYAHLAKDHMVTLAPSGQYFGLS